MDGGGFASAKDVKALERRVNELDKRLAVFEAKVDTTASFKSQTPSKSEFLAALKPQDDGSKKSNDAVELAKVMGPWFVALLSLVTMLVQHLIRQAP